MSAFVERRLRDRTALTGEEPAIKHFEDDGSVSEVDEGSPLPGSLEGTLTGTELNLRRPTDSQPISFESAMSWGPYQGCTDEFYLVDGHERVPSVASVQRGRPSLSARTALDDG